MRQMQPVNETQRTTSDTTDNAYEAREKEVKTITRWAALAGALAIGILYLALPEKLTFGPNWLLLVIEAVLLLPFLLASIFRHPLRYITGRVTGLTLLGVVTVGLAGSIALLIYTLPTEKGVVLLRSAALLWCTNILVFALWYWEIDGGGPRKRLNSGHQATDFMFPQQVDGNSTKWMAHFVDYLFLAFTGATALSPADTYPLTRPAKALMMIEAVLSMIIIVLLAARAVNIYG
ncbi:MAG TPA: hypothetical protein VKP04_03475 [Ktedonobacteraceae bacterium]|nr:hypothetical protein [Ktedonobacteraceae bacterium]